MDPASRPSPERLAELPLEEPLDADLRPLEPPTVAVAAHTSPVAAVSREPLRGPGHGDLNFTDPELYLPASDARVLAAMAAAPAAPRATQPAPELTLEDPVIDELLASTSPTRPPFADPPKVAPAPATPAPAPAAREAPKPPAAQPVPLAPRPAPVGARVPIVKTEALKAAAVKLAAATAARSAAARPLSVPAAPSVPVARAPAAPVAPPKATAPQAVERPRLETPRAAAPRPEAARTEAPRGETARVEAASLASWANARASTTAARPASAPVAPPTPLAPAARNPKLQAVAVPAAPASSPAPPSSSAPMDRDFIARNQVVERYLSGRLPLKGATDFERFCREHPELLDQIGLPEKVNAGLRLLEASGKPEPWQQPAQPLWQRPQLTLGLAVTAAALVLALIIAVGSSVSKNQRIAALEKQSYERALDPATSTREIRLLPSRSGASVTPAITIGGPNAQLADFKIDESRSPYHTFRITIDRIDQGRVAVITNLQKDSNGHLRVALNSSALGPGSYKLTVEGIGLRGDPQPDSWITIGIVR